MSSDKAGNPAGPLQSFSNHTVLLHVRGQRVAYCKKRKIRPHEMVRLALKGLTVLNSHLPFPSSPIPYLSA